MTPSMQTGLHVAQWFEVTGAGISLIFCVWYGIVMEWRDWLSLHIFSFVLVILTLLGLSSAQFFFPSLVTHASFIWTAIIVTCFLTLVLAWRLFEFIRLRYIKKS